MHAMLADEPVRASPGPTEAPQTLAFGGLTTGSPQTKRDYAAHGGTVAMMVVSGLLTSPYAGELGCVILTRSWS